MSDQPEPSAVPFSRATLYEICQRYVGGIIDRAQLVDELTRSPYVKGGTIDARRIFPADSTTTK